MKYLLIFVVIYYSFLLCQQFLISKDAAVYLVLARSLAYGNGYLNDFLPIPTPHTHYPPGYPFILSLVMRIFGDKLLFFRIINIILSGLSLLILGSVLGKYLKKKEVLMVLALFALNPRFIQFTHTVNSEIGYILFSWLAIIFIMDGENFLSTKKILWAALIIIMGFYVRTIGITLYLSLLIYLLIRKRRREFFIVILLGLTIIPWVSYVLIKSEGYGREFMMKGVHEPSIGMIKVLDIPMRFFSNLKYYAGKTVADLLFFPYFKEVTFGNFFFPVKISLSLLFSFLFLTGFYSFIKKNTRIIEIYCIVYFIAPLFWPYHTERYLLPIYPFLLGYLFISLSGQKLQFARMMIIIILMIPILLGNIKTVKNLFEQKRFSKSSFLETRFWLKKNTRPEAIIMSYDPAGIYLYTQRKGVFLDLRTNPIESIAEIKEKKVNFLLVEKEAGLTIRGKKIRNFDRYIKPLLEEYSDSFSLVYQTSTKPEILIYGINVSVENNK